MKKLAPLIAFLLIVPSVVGDEILEPLNYLHKERPRYALISDILVLIVFTGLIIFALRFKIGPGPTSIALFVLSLVVGVTIFSALSNSMYFYDMITEKYSLPFRADQPDCVTYNDKVYCFGVPNKYDPPFCPGSSGCKEVWEYSNGKWTKKLTLSYPFYGTSCAVLNDKIYCIGGAGNEGYYHPVTYNRVLIYDPNTNTASYKTISYSIAFTTCVPYGDYIYCFGGFSWESGENADLNPYYNIWRYDPSTNDFVIMKSGIEFYDLYYSWFIGAAPYGGKIYFGGAPCFQYVYDPSTNSYTKFECDKYVIEGTHCPVVDGKAYCWMFGNLDVSYLGQEKFDWYGTDAMYTGGSTFYYKGKICTVRRTKMYCLKV